jgi:hypothetical protein
MIDDKPIRALKCDNEECNKEITYDRREEKVVFEANPWLKSTRLVQTLDGRNLVYCSDICEIIGAKTGKHNLPAPKKIIDAGNQAAVQAAAAAEAAARASDEALKNGTGGPVIIP